MTKNELRSAPPTADKSYQAALLGAQVRQLYSISRAGIVGALVSVFFLVLALRSQIPQTALIAWVAAYCLVQIPRYYLVFAFFRTNPETEAMGRWGSLYTILTVLSAAVWGASAIFIFPSESPAHQMFLSISLCGIASAAALVYCPLKKCSIPSILAMTIPLAARCLYEGGEVQTFVAGTLTIFTVFVVLTGLQMNRFFVDSFNLQLEKNSLINSITDQKNVAERLNRELFEEIEERRRTEAALKNSEQKLRESEGRYRNLLDTMNEGFIILDIDYMITYVNDRMCDMWKYPRSQIIARPITEFVDTDKCDTDKFKQDLLHAGSSRSFEVTWTGRNGLKIPTIIAPRTMVDSLGKTMGSFAVITDITELKIAEGRIKASLIEKEVLLREIHHRVKNNLQIISSLLKLQSRYMKDPAALEMMYDTQNRITSMAIVHEKLYKSENFAKVRIKDYINSLISHLIASCAEDNSSHHIRKDIQEISLGVDMAIPLGFIVTELISNCLKHAFPMGFLGEIYISLLSNGDGFELVVADNGKGIGENIDYNQPSSFGLRLVNIFVQQIQGTLDIQRKAGTEIRVKFKMIEHAAPRPMNN